MKSILKFIAIFSVFMTLSTSTVEASSFSDLKKEIKTIVKKEIKSYVNKKLNELSSETSQQEQPDYSTLTFVDFDQPRVDYSNLDHLNRVGQATAYLTKQNVTKSTEQRSGQSFTPTGFVKNAKIWDRGHLIAYSLTYNLDVNGKYSKGQDGSLNNALNLFTQTSQSNRGEMKRIENDVRQVLKSGERVIYRVTPYFENDELVARYVTVEAISEFGTLNIKEIVENVQDGKAIDYKTGRVRSVK